MIDILVASELTQVVLDKLGGYARLSCVEKGASVVIPKDEIRKRVEAVNPEILVVDATPIDEEVLGNADKLRFIHCTRGNPVNIDLDYCKKRGILVGRSPGRNANAVAEFTFGLMINITRRINIANRTLARGGYLVSGAWQEKRDVPVEDVIWNSSEFSNMPYQEFRSPELAGKTLGLVGFGAIGRMIAKKAKVFDMDIVAYDPYVKDSGVDFVKMVSLDELASCSDIVSLHAKETPETVNMANKEFLSKMKMGSYLVNTSRGKLVDRFALIDAVEGRRLAGVALDVFDYEPLCKDDPLLNYDQILVTPHIGGASSDVIMHHSKASLDNILAYVNGEEIVHPYE